MNLSVTVLTSKNKFIGNVKMELDSLCYEPQQDIWLPLLDKNGRPNPKISGEVHISLEYRGPKLPRLEDDQIPPDEEVTKKEPPSWLDRAEEEDESDRRILFGSNFNQPNKPTTDFIYDENDTDTIILQKERVTQDAKQSLSRSLKTLDNTTRTAVKTQIKLEAQGKQLENVSCELDRMDAQLEVGQRYMRGIKSMFGNWGRRRNKDAEVLANSIPSLAGNPKERRSRTENSNAVLERNQLMSSKQQTRESNGDELDDGINMISERINHLKKIAVSYSFELANQTETINQVDQQISDNSEKLQKERTQVRKLINK